MTLKGDKWPGIDPKWKAGWKAHHRNRLEWFELYDPLTKNELEHFASTGTTLAELAGTDWSVYRRWERGPSSKLKMLSLLKQFEIEQGAMGEQRFDHQAAASCYAAARLSELIRIHLHIKSPERLGTQLASMDMQMLPATALGVAIGSPSALQLARLQVAASARGWYSHDDYSRYPVFLFILLLLASFIQEARPLADAALFGNSPLAPLLENWDTPQADTISPLCLAACDFHTTRCAIRQGREFSGGAWGYTPVEIMLLMRLRSLRGLENPQFQQPLWNSAYSGVEDGIPVHHDELIDRVEQRMRTDGYDEDFITRHVLSR